jgi:hypothetical protein
MPSVGQAVTLADNYDFDPMQRVPRGAKGVVTFVQRDGDKGTRIGVKMNDHFDALDEFDGCIWFYDVGGCDSGTFANGFTWGVVMEFHRVCRYYTA